MDGQWICLIAQEEEKRKPVGIRWVAGERRDAAFVRSMVVDRAQMPQLHSNQ